MRALLAALLLSLSAGLPAAVPDNALLRKPVLIRTPEYPAKAFRKRLQGDVEVCFEILADGRVYKPYVSSSSARVFNRSALRAIRESRFEADPAGTGRIRGCRVYRFRLQPIESA